MFTQLINAIDVTKVTPSCLNSINVIGSILCHLGVILDLGDIIIIIIIIRPRPAFGWLSLGGWSIEYSSLVRSLFCYRQLFIIYKSSSLESSMRSIIGFLLSERTSGVSLVIFHISLISRPNSGWHNVQNGNPK